MDIFQWTVWHNDDVTNVTNDCVALLTTTDYPPYIFSIHVILFSTGYNLEQKTGSYGYIKQTALIHIFPFK